MKIKDLTDKKQSLAGLKVKTPTGVVGYWRSQWSKGVWLSSGRPTDNRIYPQFVDSLKDCSEWEVHVDDEINCDKLQSLKFIDNCTEE